jgi:hypothetical protein
MQREQQVPPPLSGRDLPGFRWCGVSQVIKTAQSRGRTERTLFTREFCSPQATPSSGAGMLRTGVIRHFDVTLPFVAAESSGWQALMFPRWRRQMHGQSAPMQGQAGPSWQDGAEVRILLID